MKIFKYLSMNLIRYLMNILMKKKNN